MLLPSGDYAQFLGCINELRNHLKAIFENEVCLWKDNLQEVICISRGYHLVPGELSCHDYSLL